MDTSKLGVIGILLGQALEPKWKPKSGDVIRIEFQASEGDGPKPPVVEIPIKTHMVFTAGVASRTHKDIMELLRSWTKERKAEQGGGNQT